MSTLKPQALAMLGILPGWLVAPGQLLAQGASTSGTT